MEFLSNAHGRPLAVDTETNAQDIRDGRGFAMGISIAYRVGTTFHSAYFPFRHRGVGNYGDDVLIMVRDLIENAPKLVFHNAKFDIVSLRTLGIKVRSGSWYDTMIMAHLINENWPRAKSLDSCVHAYVSKDLSKKKAEIQQIIDTIGWSFIPADEMDEYASFDAELTYRLFLVLYPKFQAENLDDYWPHKARLLEVVIAMEERGVGVDVALCEKMIREADILMDEYEHFLGGNPASGADLKRILIDDLKLPVVKTTSTGRPSFDKEAMSVYETMLETRKDIDPDIVEYILGYRGWQKARSAFYEAYIKFLSPDGRLRPSYRHHKDSEEGGTVTGRLSCANPNLQQIPRKSNKPWNGSVKSAFKPADGYSLFEADYSQLELRLGTQYANEPTLREIFREGRDIFTELAKELGWPRQDVKTFVYSTQYGAGKKRISDVFGVSEPEAVKLINHYYDMFPGFRRVIALASAECLTRGKVKLWSGRYRHFQNRKDEQHKAFNSRIQGGAADIVERIMVRLYDLVDQPSNGEVRMLLQVHDSVIFEIKDGTYEKWAPKILEVMTNLKALSPDFDVTFAVDIHKFGE